MRNKLILFVSAILIIGLSCSKKTDKKTLNIDTNQVIDADIIDNDSIYELPPSTAVLDNYAEFYKENNKYYDWPANDAKRVVLKGIAKKNGSFEDVAILRSSGIDKLDDEALRLCGKVKLSPALNESGEPVNSYFVISVNYPSPK